MLLKASVNHMNATMTIHGIIKAVINYTFQTCDVKMGATLRTDEFDDEIDFFRAVFPISSKTTNYDRLKTAYYELNSEH